MEIGLPNWWAHALPTFGWVLIALGELDEAKHYFHSVYKDAEAHERHPVRLDAQAGLLYIAALHTTEYGTAKDDTAAERKTVAEIGEHLRQICRHPAATQQTRDRVERITQEWGF